MTKKQALSLPLGEYVMVKHRGALVEEVDVMTASIKVMYSDSGRKVWKRYRQVKKWTPNEKGVK